MHCTDAAVIAGFRASASTAAISSTPRPHRTRSDVWRKLVEPQTGEGLSGVQLQAISRTTATSGPTNIALNRTRPTSPSRGIIQIESDRLSRDVLASPLPISRLLYGRTIRPPPPTFRLSSPRSPAALFSRTGDPITFRRFRPTASRHYFVPFLRRCNLHRDDHGAKFFQ